MTLVLHAVALNDEPMSQPLIGRFDERGGTLGRSDSATFTLPDPERTISRVQAHVLHPDNNYWMENVSNGNAILHNGRLLSPGMRVVLHEGDELKIGSYTLQAAFESDETSETILRGRTANPSPVRPPAVSSMARPAGPPVMAQASSPASGSDVPPGPLTPPTGLWRAFLEGAGIDPAADIAPTPELFAAVGAMMKISVEGIHRLVAMRATAKDEMRAQMTVIQVRDNNPLKFAPDGFLALQLLLQPPARGFLSGPEALRDAMTDLQSHQVGVMAGMRAALEGVLERFDPAKLDGRLAERSVFDSLRPAGRRARLWELYLEHYRSLREEAQEDFERFFAAAFREAYEAQVRSLEDSGTPR